MSKLLDQMKKAEERRRDEHWAEARGLAEARAREQAERKAAALARLRPRRWRFAAAAILAALAAGAGFYAVVRAPQRAITAAATDRPVVLRLDHNVEAIAIRER